VARPGEIFPIQRPCVDGGPRPRLRRRRGVEDEDAAMEVHDHRELFEAAAAARDLRDEEAGAQVVGDGVEPPAWRGGSAAARGRRGAAQCGEAGGAQLGSHTGFSFASAVGKGKFWVPSPFAVQDANHRMSIAFGSGLLETVLALNFTTALLQPPPQNLLIGVPSTWTSIAHWHLTEAIGP
jgi:hypothetical protein